MMMEGSPGQEEITVQMQEKPGLELEIETSSGLSINNIEYYKDDIDSLGVENFLIQRGQQKGSLLFWVVERTIKKYQENEYKEINVNHQRNASLLLYLLIPLFAFFMKMFRWKNSFTEHITFTLYFFSAFFFIQLLSLLVDRIFYSLFSIPLTGLVFVPLTIIYLIIAIHRNYNFGWIKSVLIGLLNGALLYLGYF